MQDAMLYVDLLDGEYGMDTRRCSMWVDTECGMGEIRHIIQYRMWGVGDRM